MVEANKSEGWGIYFVACFSEGFLLYIHICTIYVLNIEI